MKKIVTLILTSLILFSMTFQSTAEAAPSKKLDEKSKIALAYFTKDIGKYSFTKKEVLSGRYVSKLIPRDYITYSKHFDLYKRTYKIKGAPKNMKFYSTKISRGNYITIIGVSDTDIVMLITQSDITYESFSLGGKKYKMKDYLKYRNTKDFKKIVNKIRIVKGKF